MTDHRREPLRIVARIEQLMAEVESYTGQEILLRASRLTADYRRMFAEVEVQRRR